MFVLCGVITCCSICFEGRTLGGIIVKRALSLLLCMIIVLSFVPISQAEEELGYWEDPSHYQLSDWNYCIDSGILLIRTMEGPFTWLGKVNGQDLFNRYSRAIIADGITTIPSDVFYSGSYFQKKQLSMIWIPASGHGGWR